MSMSIAVLTLSLALQLVAATLAIRLIRYTRGRVAWSLIAAAAVLMGARRAVTLANLVAGGPYREPELGAEVIALVISILMVAGLLLLGPLFREMRGAIEVLRISERKFRALADELPQIVVETDAEGRITFANAATHNVLGHRRNTLEEGVSVLDLVAPHDRPRASDRLRDGLRGDPIPPFELDLVRTDGNVVPVLASAAPIVEEGRVVGIRGTGLDLTDRKRAEQAFRESEERFRRAFDDAPTGMALFDTDDRILQVNQAFCEMLGRSSAELVGAAAAEITHPDDRERHVASRQAAIDAGLDEYRFRKRYLHADGRVVSGQVRVAMVRDDEGKLVYSITQVEDITERLGLEEQLLQSQKMEAIGRLAGGVAHDFNNILTAILGYGTVLIERLPEGDPGRAAAEQIVRGGERAAALTRQLLAFSRRQVMQLRVVELDTVLAGMEEMLRRLIGEDVELVLELDPEPWSVKVDPGQMEQVVLNLVVNARDAMPRGGRLMLRTRRLTLGWPDEARGGLPPEGDCVVLEVEDNGIGMTEEVRAHLFEPFFTTKEVGKGTGLGLATAYGIVRQTGGTIEADSEPGRGSIFRIYIPRTLEREAPADAASASAGPGRSIEATVLIVEDEEQVREVTREVLASAGFRVLVAADAVEGVAVAERHEGVIHLLLTDVVMPGLSGPELAREIERRRPGIKVLFVSGHAEEALEPHGLTEAGWQLIAKPWNSTDLVARVLSTLGPIASIDAARTEPGDR